jgi:uncharacterized RDD family membrane protein YckC
VTWPPTPPTPAPPPPSSLPPPGWYPDPSGQPAHRWWDGTRWTEHVGTPPPPLSLRPQVVLGSGTAELAGWWRRFGGYALDIVMVDVADLVVDRLIRAADVALRAPLSPGLHAMTPGAQLATVVATLLIVLGYPFVLLRSRGQTVGMMAAGVRAVDRASGALPTTAQVWRRVLTFAALTVVWLQIAAVVGFNHVVGPRPPVEVLLLLVGVAGLLTTGLWPLCSPLSQTLQDKAAGTIVVRSRS